ncbi:MAG: acyl carrier protein [Myxococcota bacterium]
MDKELTERLTTYIRDELVPGYDGALDAETPLLEEGVLDSMRIMRLLSHLEEAFDVEVGSDDFEPENFASVAAISELIARKRG